MHSVYPHLLPNLCHLGTKWHITTELSQEFHTWYTTCGKAHRNVNVCNRHCLCSMSQQARIYWEGVDCTMDSGMHIQLVCTECERYHSLVNSVIFRARHTNMAQTKQWGLRTMWQDNLTDLHHDQWNLWRNNHDINCCVKLA